jgi:hypothetical protein
MEARQNVFDGFEQACSSSRIRTLPLFLPSISEHIKLGYACNLMRVIINLTAPNWPRLSPKRESGLVQLALKLRAAIK